MRTFTITLTLLLTAACASPNKAAHTATDSATDAATTPVVVTADASSHDAATTTRSDDARRLTPEERAEAARQWMEPRDEPASARAYIERFEPAQSEPMRDDVASK